MLKASSEARDERGQAALPLWALRLAVAVALPTLACTGYYAAGDLGDGQGQWTVPVILALPLALIGGIGLVAELLKARPSRPRCGFLSLLAVLPVIFLFVIHH